MTELDYLEITIMFIALPLFAITLIEFLKTFSSCKLEHMQFKQWNSFFLVIFSLSLSNFMFMVEIPLTVEGLKFFKTIVIICGSTSIIVNTLRFFKFRKKVIKLEAEDKSINYGEFN